jgi:putative transcriptional regulator
MKPPCRVVLIALLAFAAGAHAQGLKAMFLIARPGMPDLNFGETVVLTVQGENGEATGVIINRPTNRSLAELLPSERFEAFTDPIFFGGPVAQQGLFALFQSDKYSGPAVPMLPGVWFAVLPDSVDGLLGKPPAKIRLFSGYSGWAPGQLQVEIDRGDWLVVDADAKTLFLKDTSRLWKDMVERARAVRAEAAPPPRRIAISSNR